MRNSKMSIAVFAVIIILCLTLAPQAIWAGTNESSSAESQLMPPSFEAAWQNYLHAFNPVRDAVRMNDYKSLKQHMAHFKDTLTDLRDSDIRPNLRRPVKKILKLSKNLIQVAQKGNSDKISVSTEKLKQAIDKFEERRAQGK